MDDREAPSSGNEDWTSARLRRVRLRDARMRMVDLTGAVLRDVDLTDVRIDGVIDGLRVNGVAVGPRVIFEEEYEPRRFAERDLDDRGYRRLNPPVGPDDHRTIRADDQARCPPRACRTAFASWPSIRATERRV